MTVDLKAAAHVTSADSPLSQLAAELRRASAAGSADVAIREAPFLALLNLRTDPDGPAAEALATHLGLRLPTAANTVSRAGELDLLWLGPDEWLIVSPPDTQRELEARLRAAVGEQHCSLVDVSAGRAVIELTGPLAAAVLSHGCALDLDSPAFGPGTCAQTMVARAQVVLQRLADEPGYRIFVAASFADYLARWLCDALTEY